MHKQIVLVVNRKSMIIMVFEESNNQKHVLDNQNDLFMHFLAMNCNGQVATKDWSGARFLLLHGYWRCRMYQVLTFDYFSMCLQCLTIYFIQFERHDYIAHNF
jgi:hypothetical protein